MQIVFLDSDTIPVPMAVPEWATGWENRPATAQETDAVVDALANADICITNKIRITSAILQRLPRLKFVCVAATGYDCVDLQACREHGVVVSNVPGYSRQSVAEGVIGFIFALRRALPYYQYIGRQAWTQSPHFCVHGTPVLNVKGATLGIFGRGAIGNQVGELARAIGMQVIYGEHRNRPDIRPDYVRFETLLAQSDVISLHCPLTEATRGMIGHAEISRMKPGAMLVNTSRGALVDTGAVIAALKSRQLGALAIDVYEQESALFFQDRSGDIIEDDQFQRLMTFPNVLVTGHQGFFTVEALQEISAVTLANLHDFATGRPCPNRLAMH